MQDGEKSTKGKNPFENFEINIIKKLELDYNEDYIKVKTDNRFLYNFFKNTSEVSTTCLQCVLNEIINLVINNLT